MKNKSVPSGRKIVFMIDATEDCNFSCKYCYFGLKGKRKMEVQKVYEAVCRTVMSFLLDNKVSEVELYYMGGEPIMAWREIQSLNQLFRLFAIEHNIKMRWGMTSNISLLTEEMANIMISEGAGLHISIDGTPDIHNKNRPLCSGLSSYDLVKNRLPLALKISPNDLARVTICPEDVERLEEIADHLFSIGFNQVGLFPAYNMNWSNHAINSWAINISKAVSKSSIMADGKRSLRTIFTEDRILSKATNRNTYCGAGKSLLAINVEGKLFNCHHFTNNQIYSICDASETTPEDIRSMLKSSMSWQQTATIPEQCRDCPAKSACNGGCWSDNLINNKNEILPEETSCKVRLATFISLRPLFVGDRIPNQNELQVIKDCTICYTCQKCYTCENGGCQSTCEECQSCVECQSRCESCERGCDSCQSHCEYCEKCYNYCNDDQRCTGGCDCDCTMM